MTLPNLIDKLIEFQNKYGDDLEIDLMIEIPHDAGFIQYQYPLQDLAYSASEKKIILIREKSNE